MGSVPKPRCARGNNCYHVLYLQSDGPPKVPHEGDLCGKCQRHYAEGAQALATGGWRERVIEAIEAVRPGKAVLWDVFALNPHNGGWRKLSDRGEIFRCLDAHTLTKLRDWLDENRDRAVERYGYDTWQDLRTNVGCISLVGQLPAEMQLYPDAEDGLPIQVVAVRTDGKKWDLNIPIRAELLRLARRYFSERDYAKLLRIGRHFYRNMRARMNQERFTLDKIMVDSLDRMVRGKKRGRKQKL